VEEENSTPKRKSFFGVTLSETLLLGAVPFLAYLFTFVYQAGYLKAFELPLQFISITLVDVFNIGGKVLGIFFFVFISLNLFSNFLPKGNISFPLAKRVSQLLPLFLLSYPFLYLFEWGMLSNIMLAVLIFAISIMFLPPLIRKKYKGTYLQKMEKIDGELKGASNPWDGNLLDRTENLIGHNTFVKIVYFLLGIYITYYAGMAAAQKQEIFYVANTSPESVVLFMTSEKMISAPFDNVTKVIEPEFLVTNLSNSADLKLHFVNTSRLKLDKSLLTPIPTSTSTPTPIPIQKPTNTPPLPIFTQTP
jgi:hypothetical protein